VFGKGKVPKNLQFTEEDFKKVRDYVHLEMAEGHSKSLRNVREREAARAQAKAKRGCIGRFCSWISGDDGRSDQTITTQDANSDHGAVSKAAKDTPVKNTEMKISKKEPKSKHFKEIMNKIDVDNENSPEKGPRDLTTITEVSDENQSPTTPQDLKVEDISVKKGGNKDKKVSVGSDESDDETSKIARKNVVLKDVKSNPMRRLRKINNRKPRMERLLSEDGEKVEDV